MPLSASANVSHTCCGFPFAQQAGPCYPRRSPNSLEPVLGWLEEKGPNLEPLLHMGNGKDLWIPPAGIITFWDPQFFTAGKTILGLSQQENKLSLSISLMGFQ